MYEVVELTSELISDEILDHYERTQSVNRHYYIENGIKMIKAVNFTDDWSLAVRRDIVKKFFRDDAYYKAGIFVDDKLIAFYVLERQFMRNPDYINLNHLQVSRSYRNKGLGRVLFEDAKKVAISFGAKKLYISAHSAFETQKFYTSLGCVNSKWICEESAAREPYDIQLEYQLDEGFNHLDRSDLSISELMKLSRTLHNKYKDKWEPMTPEYARDSILYMIEEVGEVIAIIKKKAITEIMENADVRTSLIEEMSDVLMYFTDALNRFEISSEEFSEAYVKKYEKNLKRDFSKEHAEFITSNKHK